jgi:hypothetical protein
LMRIIYYLNHACYYCSGSPRRMTRNTKNEPERWTTSSQFSLAEPSRRTSHISWFPIAMEVHEYTLERFWSQLSNSTGLD